MSNVPPNPPGTAEFLQATIAVEHLDSAKIETEVRRVIEAQPGVQSVSLVEGKLHICYDPLQTSERELEVAIERSGKHATEGTCERTSPFSDLG